MAGKKVYKYGETCDELGYDLIPFAIETYGKFGKAAIKHLKVLQTMAVEEGVRCEAGTTPWFARSFVDGATQARRLIGVALQRSTVRDQLRRAHVRRSLGGDACSDEDFCSPDSDSDGGQGSSVRASSQSSEGAVLELTCCGRRALENSCTWVQQFPVISECIFSSSSFCSFRTALLLLLSV